jgi:hypothetical protein
MNKKILILSLLIVLVSGVVSFSKQSLSQSSGPLTGDLSGYAWSDNIGWVSFDGVKVEVNNNLSGYAWSDNIGWVSFNEATGCPTSPCQPKIEANKIVGWAKALSADNKGWDGWISLGTQTGDSISYGPTLSGNTFSGFAWGSDVVGWLDFSQVTGQTTPSPDCGTAEGQTFSNPPTDPTLCSVGTSSAVGTNPNTYTWTCNSGTQSVSCSATRFIAPPLDCAPVITATQDRTIVDTPSSRCIANWTVENRTAGTSTCPQTGLTCTFDGNPVTSYSQSMPIGTHVIRCTNSTGVTTTYTPNLQCRLNPNFGEF